MVAFLVKLSKSPTSTNLTHIRIIEETAMFPQLARFTDLGILLLRLMVGLVFVTSGYSHLKNSTARAKSIGMSKPFTIFLGIAEAAGGLGVAFGVLTQLAAFGLILATKPCAAKCFCQIEPQLLQVGIEPVHSTCSACFRPCRGLLISIQFCTGLRCVGAWVPDYRQLSPYSNGTSLIIDRWHGGHRS